MGKRGVSSLFRGRHTHAIDNKGRVSIPVKFREILEDLKEERIVLTTHVDRCLVGFTPKEWSLVEEKVLTAAAVDEGLRAFQRHFISGAVDCVLDSQGRILVAPSHREHAFLNKEVIFVGLLNRFELWDFARWHQTAVPPEKMPEISQTMARFGL
jgi:MraZ protein